MTTRVIEVFADVTCPFTHVGLRRLVEHRERLRRPDVVLRVRAWPLELVNDEPLVADAVAKKIQALRVDVAPDLFGGFDAGHFPSTSIPALALAARAYERDDQAGEQVSLALRDALFEQSSDISDVAVLGAIARSVGLDQAASDRASDDRELVTADWLEGRRRGVEGSPYFFVNGRGIFCPTLDIRHVDGNLEIELDRVAFVAFTAEVFGDRPTAN